MIPMNLKLPGGGKASVSWASVFWIGVVTTIGTVAGTYIYQQWFAQFITAPPTPGSKKA